MRPDDNLYTNSVVALAPDDGTLRWHYQHTPHDVWGCDGINDIILADLPVHGQMTKALLHTDRNGHYYVLDRSNDRFLCGRPFGRVTWT